MRKTALTLLVSLLFGAAALAEPSTLRFDRADLSISADFRRVAYGNLNQVAVSDKLSLPVADLLVRLEVGESAEGVQAEMSSSPLLILDPEALKRTTTSASERYSDLERRLSGPTPPGRQAVEHLGEVWIDEARYARVLIFPITVAEGTLSFHERINLTLNGASVSNSRVATTADLQQSTSAAGAVPSLAGSAGSDPDYAIVTAARFVSALARLATYRRQTGNTVEIKTIEDIETQFSGTDAAERVRAYLQDFHNRGGLFVLLAGDETVVPNRLVYQYNITGQPDSDLLQPSDLYFADLTGIWDADHDGVWGERTHDQPDFQEELRVGRLPLADSLQFERYTDNVITYETDPGHGDRGWLTRSLFYSSDQMRDYPGGGQHATLAACLAGAFAVDTMISVEQASGDDPSPNNLSAAQLDDAVTDAYGIVNIVAHGRSDGFVVRSAGYNEWPKSLQLIAAEAGDHGCVDSLFRSGKPSFYVSLACDNGGYDLGPVGAERRSIVQTLLGMRDGAVGFVGNTRWGWVSSSYLLHKAFLDSLRAHPENPAVDAMYAARKVYPYYRDLVYGLNYFGDPAMRVFTAQPSPVEIAITNLPAQQYATLSSNGLPVAGVTVVVTDSDGAVIMAEISDDAGVIGLEGLASNQLYTLTAGKAGHLTRQVELGPAIITDIDDEPDALPREFVLEQNYPNPFNPSTAIQYQLPRAAEVKLSVVNILGQEVAVLVDWEQSAGGYIVTWESGNCASGVYFYRLESAEFSAVRKMLLVR